MMKKLVLAGLTFASMAYTGLEARKSCCANKALNAWRTGQRHFVIITATYNNAPWCKRSIDSILSQTYTDFEVVITDDASTDGTPDLIAQRIEELGAANRVKLIRNTQRQGAMANQHAMIHNHCVPTDIAVIVDGDDWFINSQVLDYLSQVYADPEVWMTYGQFIEYPSGAHGFCVDMPSHVVRNNAFRSFSEIPSHLRTFYAGLFQKINRKDLCDKNGQWLSMCADIAAMFPMIEMARNGHFKFISRPLLTYNSSNPINDYKVSKSVQRAIDLDLRSRVAYSALTTLFE
jgi:glycosyltransferase involved in cell wall biosynthesis